MSLPLVRLHGEPYAQGAQHGEALRERVRENVAVYFDRFEREGKCPPDEVLRRADLYLKAIEAQNPAYAEGMRGVAAGSGCARGEIAAINVRYEILYNQYTQKAMESAAEVVDGCTSFAVAPDATADGHLLIGQNWDWVPEVLGAVLHTTDPDGFETVAFTEAGIVGGKIGVNAAGVGLCVNGLLSTDDDWSRLKRPFHVRCGEILRSRSFDDAVRVVTGEGRSCSTNFLIAQAPDRIVDIEAAPGEARLLECRSGCLTHANHFVEPERLGITEPPNPRRYLSKNRHSRMADLIAADGKVTVEALQEDLKSHEEWPNSICRHPDTSLPEEQRSITVASAVIDLTARVLWVTDRQPCENPYQRFSLG
jgi:isopenicillin-N N-acyltransferase-like protein